MADPSVYNNGFFNAATDGIFAALYFGYHAAGDYALLYESGDIGYINFFNKTVGVVLVFKEPPDICHENETFR